MEQTVVGGSARLWIVVPVLFAAFLGGCGRRGLMCTPGANVPCYCPAGQQSSETCTVAGAYTACMCSQSTADAGGVGDTGGTTTTTTPDSATTVLPGVFTPTGSMLVARGFHTATLLPSGIVLLAGGDSFDAEGRPLASAELYDPGTGTVSATGSMTAARKYHSATLLPNGMVLIAGGEDSSRDPLASAELYDPGTGAFSATGSMTVAREYHTATLLTDGMVLVAGGRDSSPFALASAELYNPGAGTFTATGTMTASRASHSATWLPNGEVLVAGGPWAMAELYDPGTGTFTATGTMTGGRSDQTATLLPNGKVLIAGGNGGAELYDPSTGTFAATGNMSTDRLFHTATLLPSGMVLVAGGEGGYQFATFFSSAELYDPGAGHFAATGSMTVGRWAHSATLLQDGTVLIAGGFGYRSAEIFSE
jgi:hypothetical protein